MRRRDLSVRAGGLILTGELAVHELRYLIAPAERAGHGYLPLLGALSVLVLAVGAGRLAGALESARRTGRDERVTVRFLAAWPVLALTIVTLFGVQETVEGLVGGGGAAALAGPFSSGGWVVLPLAVAISAVLALALTGARAAVRSAARAARAALRPRRADPRPVAKALSKLRPSLLALNLGGRAPPLSS
ncbi:MAG: hypothetical protein ACR2J6_01685 [Thermoleophilaceae bacterium]